MNIVFSVVLFIIGLFILMKCGDLLVEVCLKFSKITGISQIIIGATMVSIATALPELFVSVIASYKGSNGLAVGNSIGTVISNGALILGILLAFSKNDYKDKKRDIKLIFPVIFSVLVLIFSLDLKISLVENIILLVCFVLFFIYNLVEAKNEVKSYNNLLFEKEVLDNLNIKNLANKKLKNEVSRKKQIWLLILLFILGAGGIILGAEILVNSATKIASYLGISEEIIGLTIVAIGTSLPELVTTINSLKKKNYNLAIGNITGANIINLTLILSLSGLFGGGNLLISKLTLFVYIPLVIIISLLISMPLFLKNKSYKWQGYSLLILYFIYFVLLVVMTII